MLIINNTAILSINGQTLRADNLSDKDIAFLNDNYPEIKMVDIHRIFFSESKEDDNVLDDFNTDLLVEVNDHIQRIGIPMSLPKLLINRYNEIDHLDLLQSNELTSLDNFVKLTALNPFPGVRDDLYKFLENGFVTTPGGGFIAYRNVNVKVNGNRALNEYVSDTYISCKKQNYKPKDYAVNVDENGEYNTNGYGKYIGNLKKLYKELGETKNTIYTHAYSGSQAGNGMTTDEIVVGTPVKMNIQDCDFDRTNTCSRGLHFCSWEYLNAGYALGKHKMAVLVLPNHITSIPVDGYDGQKGRCHQYLPLGIVTEAITDVKTFETDYEQYTTEAINDLVNIQNFIDGKTYEFKSLDDLKGQLFESLSTTITDRIEKIKSKNVYLKEEAEKEIDYEDENYDYDYDDEGYDYDGDYDYDEEFGY